MVQFIKGNSYKGNHMVKAYIFINQFNMMILNNILVLGNNHSRMDLVEPSIIMVMFIKENLIKVKDVEMEFMSLIKYINILGNGNITVFGDRANFIKIMKHFFKDYFKKD